MSEQMERTFPVVGAPHVRSRESTRAVMLDVIIALLPALVFAVYNFGPRALAVTLVSAVGCVVFECLFRALTRQSRRLGDLSAAVTGVLLAFTCPVTIPYWLLLIGDFFAIVVVKELWGGLGKNIFNPALAARMFLFFCSDAMTVWVEPGFHPDLWNAVDAVVRPTPMFYLHAGDLASLRETYQLADLFLGKTGGGLGEVSSLCLLLGFGWLVFQRVISWRIPVTYLATVAALTYLFPRGGDAQLWMLCQLMGGGLMLAAVFMATDSVSSPVSPGGQLIYGALCGALTVLLRYHGAYDESVACAVLLANLAAWPLDKFIRPLRVRGRGIARTERGKGVARFFPLLWERLELVAQPPAFLNTTVLLVLALVLPVFFVAAAFGLVIR